MKLQLDKPVQYISGKMWVCRLCVSMPGIYFMNSKRLGKGIVYQPKTVSVFYIEKSTFKIFAKAVLHNDCLRLVNEKTIITNF